MDALQAYICAVQLDKSHSAAWTNLGNRVFSIPSRFWFIFQRIVCQLWQHLTAELLVICFEFGQLLDVGQLLDRTLLDVSIVPFGWWLYRWLFDRF